MENLSCRLIINSLIAVGRYLRYELDSLPVHILASTGMRWALYGIDDIRGPANTFDKRLIGGRTMPTESLIDEPT
ncbi:hypothetical protein JTE90_006365 [Oedothorax gibbosus]|uniref:Uncharacterized protein n=1 Tax=Oedothorax gibbosus TaxID=931172 RepID=A0AAV6VXG4_9ARAC|nr:hypothetical protein JTE90_006365 [Oedothorax gibbosus]